MRFLALVLLVLSTNALSTQIVEWKKKPIDIVLPIGKERIIELPDNVFVGLPANIEKLVRTQSAQGYVYLTAFSEFQSSRVQLRLHDTGEIVLLNLSASAQSMETENIVIRLPSEKKERLTNNAKSDYSAPSKNTATPVELTRFAALKLYAPERLATNDHRIRVSKAPNIDLDGLFTGKSYGVFDAEAVAVFRSGHLYLTAVKLVNKHLLPRTINFTDINADFLYATPQHLQVNQKNVPGDTTTLYIITDKPLDAALYLTPLKELNHG